MKKSVSFDKMYLYPTYLQLIYRIRILFITSDLPVKFLWNKPATLAFRVGTENFSTSACAIKNAKWIPVPIQIVCGHIFALYGAIPQ